MGFNEAWGGASDLLQKRKKASSQASALESDPGYMGKAVNQGSRTIFNPKTGTWDQTPDAPDIAKPVSLGSVETIPQRRARLKREAEAAAAQAAKNQ